MAFCTALCLALAVAVQEAPTCDRAPLVLPETVTVYVGVLGEREAYSEAVAELRQIFRCYDRAFVVVDGPSDADVDVRMLGRTHHPDNLLLRYQMAVRVVGRAILPSAINLGGQSWEHCGHNLAHRLVRLLSTPAGPQGGDRGAV